MLAERRVPVASSPVALTPRRLRREPGQAAPRELEDVHPDGRSASDQLRSHDARQHEHDGLRQRRALDVVGRRHHRRVGLERPELGAGSGERRHEPARGVRPGEIVEVGHLIARVDPVGNRLGAFDAAEHGRRVHDEIVIVAIVEVGHQRLEPAEHAGARKIAAEHVEIGRRSHVRAVEHPHERRGRHHRLEAWQVLAARCAS